MNNFESQQFRDNLANEIKRKPKGEPRDALKEEPVSENLGVIATTKTNQEVSSQHEQEPVSARKSSLSESKSREVEELAQKGNPEELISFFKGNGFSASTQVELAMHYTKELKESIRLIAWTKKRLTYTTAILEHTLGGENKSVTSAKNLIQNYLIFCRIFEESEGKIPRFGQFAYVMRSIFGGVSTKEEIYDRIANHKTFGERITIDPSEVNALFGEIGGISNDIDEKYKASQEKNNNWIKH